VLDDACNEAAIKVHGFVVCEFSSSVYILICLVGWGYPCGNCHASTNFITKVVKREQVIRDVNQHHHFWGLFVPVEITSPTTAVHLLSGSHSSFAPSTCLKCIAILPKISRNFQLSSFFLPGLSWVSKASKQTVLWSYVPWWRFWWQQL
jgi:hypothetical protein